MPSDELISVFLARKLVQASFESHRMIGVLIDRKGQVKWVIAGDSVRLYLPDIGRARGAKDRLRGLRLIVARPTPLHRSSVRDEGKFGFILAKDFETDLEKLRLDAVLEIDASLGAFIDGPMVLGHLSTETINKKTSIFVRQTTYHSIHKLKESFTDLIKIIEEEIKKLDEISKKAIKENFLERAILVGIYNQSKKEGLSSMKELEELALSARVQVVDKIVQWRNILDPKTVIGSGKLEEICLYALSLGVEVIIFDRDLSPSQLMHITDLTDLKVLDRTMLILDIFAQRAKTREGKMQVEMAQLTYSLPRLAEKQTGLSRLTGGIGGKGPGETKLEINKRRVKDRLASLERELKEIKKQRELRRKTRKDNKLPILAIVGYTNAGKSTLLNNLTKSNVYAKDELFATLDPHSRRLRFPSEQEVILTDTVGFIKNLPPSLMKAFKATLEELNEADILLHVVDLSCDNFRSQIKVVEEIIDELNLNQKPKILVFNKIDLLTDEEIKEKLWGLEGVLISASKGLGLKKLISECSQALLH